MTLGVGNNSMLKLTPEVKKRSYNGTGDYNVAAGKTTKGSNYP